MSKRDIGREAALAGDERPILKTRKRAADESHEVCHGLRPICAEASSRFMLACDRIKVLRLVDTPDANLFAGDIDLVDAAGFLREAPIGRLAADRAIRAAARGSRCHGRPARSSRRDGAPAPSARHRRPCATRSCNDSPSGKRTRCGVANHAANSVGILRLGVVEGFELPRAIIDVVEVVARFWQQCRRPWRWRSPVSTQRPIGLV